MGWLLRRSSATVSRPAPAGFRIRFRLIHLLLVPWAIAAAHYALVAWRGEPYAGYDCATCGAHRREVLNRLFGYWPVGVRDHIEDTPCSRLLRIRCGWVCAKHAWERDDSRADRELFEFQHPGRGRCLTGIDRTGPWSDFLRKTPDRVWALLDSTAAQSPEEVRGLVGFLLDPQGFEPVWRALREALNTAAESSTDIRGGRTLRGILGSTLDDAAWAAVCELGRSAPAWPIALLVAKSRPDLAIPLSAWMVDHGAPEERGEALSILGSCGRRPGVVPILARALNDPDNGFQAVWDLERLGIDFDGVEDALARGLEGGSAYVRTEILEGIAHGELKPRTGRMIPLVAKVLGEPGVDGRAALAALRTFGDAAHEAVLAALPLVPRDRCLWYLWAIRGWPSQRLRAARTFVLSCTTASDAYARQWVASMLPKLGPTDPGVEPALELLLNDGDAEVRKAAQMAGEELSGRDHALSAAELEAQAARRAFEEAAIHAAVLLRDPDPRVRLHGLEEEWQRKPGPLPDSLVQLLSGLIDDASPSVAWAALQLAARIGPDARPLAERVRARTSDPAEEIRESAAQALQAIDSGF